MTEAQILNRDQIDEQYKWDLTPMYASDEAWEDELKAIDALIEKLLEKPLYVKTPVVRNGAKATVGYQPDVWKAWE